MALHALCENLLATAVRVARGGQEALDYCSAAAPSATARNSPSDLIILDLNMPVVDGYRVLRQLKDAEALKRIPVVCFAPPMPKAAGPSRTITRPTATGEAVSPEASAATFLRIVFHDGADGANLANVFHALPPPQRRSLAEAKIHFAAAIACGAA